MYKKYLTILILVSLVILPIYAEEVTLKNGEKMTGKVVKQNDKSLFLDVGFTIIDIPSDEVAKVEKTSTETPPSDDAKSEPAEFKDLVSYITQPRRIVKRVYSATEVANKHNDSIVAVNVGGSLRGSGFVITPKGHIITNHHVIAGETKIGITIYQQKGNTVDKKKIDEVTILGFNRYFDIALLQIKEADLKDLTLMPVMIGDFNQVKKGDPTFAFGNPLGLERTISEGIVSTRGRDIRGLPYMQTTAPINPGNSGSPLLNAHGEVIGLVTYGVSYYEGLGFGLPSNYILEFIKSIEAYAYDKDNPNYGYRYCPAPRKKSASTNDADKKKDKKK
ncbi:MAG: trypsin-like peptidase domain-containing protein [Planctomycetes bacterium]|nr:trypsin-like peptidase domain-containing protein [Planctomycetota bacterium]